VEPLVNENTVCSGDHEALNEALLHEAETDAIELLAQLDVML
jgi:hypothetical protein